MGAALQRRFFQPCLGKHRLRKLDMHGLSVVGGAGERQLAVAEAEGISGPAFNQRQRLDRLHGRAREDRAPDISDLEHGATVRVVNGHGAAVPAFHILSTENFDENRIGHAFTKLDGLL